MNWWLNVGGPTLAQILTTVGTAIVAVQWVKRQIRQAEEQPVRQRHLEAVWRLGVALRHLGRCLKWDGLKPDFLGRLEKELQRCGDASFDAEAVAPRVPGAELWVLTDVMGEVLFWIFAQAREAQFLQANRPQLDLVIEARLYLLYSQVIEDWLKLAGDTLCGWAGNDEALSDVIEEVPHEAMRAAQFEA